MLSSRWREIELAVGARRRADADDRHVEPVELAVDATARCAPGPSATPAVSSSSTMRLDHGRAAGADRGHLLRIDVDAEHMVPGLGEAGGGGGADIAEAEDGDAQGRNSTRNGPAEPDLRCTAQARRRYQLRAHGQAARSRTAPGGRPGVTALPQTLAPKLPPGCAQKQRSSASTCARRSRSTICCAQGAVRNIAIRPSPLGTCCMRSTVSAWTYSS